MKTRRRMLSVLLAVMLIIGLVPVSVFAEGSTAPAAAGDVVTIPDPDFQKLINSQLGQSDGTNITEEDMEKLTYLEIKASSGVKDIDGIQYAVNLKNLKISGDIQNVGKIEGLKNLTDLSIENNSMTDLSQLGSKPTLKKLNLSGCRNLVSLQGLTGKNYPALQVLDCSNCGALSDISALKDRQIPTLTEADFENCSSITDITPLMGYSFLETLNLEKIKITEGNREGYRDTIRSLINLTELYMPYCGVTDEDTEMFSTLTNLETLVLNMNNLTSTAFCDHLPVGMTALSLHGNAIENMNNLGRLTNLTILGLGDNYVTDFSFIPKLTSLTSESIRHAEGEEDYPFKETYSYGSESDPIEIENGRIVLDNPYIGADGKPVSFANATVNSSDGQVTMSYDEDTQEITISDIPAGTPSNEITITVRYDLPVSGNEFKIGELRVKAYVKEKVRYTVHYDWGTEAPEGQILPSDATEYQSLDDAKAAVDKTFTSETTVKGEKDGKKGVWMFSGWKVTVAGNIVNATGFWSFVENHEHNWGQPTYTWSEDGKTCTAERACTENSSHVESETVDTAGEVTTPPTCMAKGQTTYTAVFTSSWAQTQIKALKDVERVPHSYGAEWKSDGTGHWRMCEVCEAKIDEAEHNFEWIVDQEATDTQAGSRHQECTVCGYALAAVEIPQIENPEDTEQPEVPQTGDTENLLLWIVFCAAAASVLGATFCVKKKQVNR